MMMRKAEGDEELTGNDRFEGYCKDMMDLIAKKLGINCNSLIIFFKYFQFYKFTTRKCRRVTSSQRSKVWQ